MLCLHDCRWWWCSANVTRSKTASQTAIKFRLTSLWQLWKSHELTLLLPRPSLCHPAKICRALGIWQSSCSWCIHRWRTCMWLQIIRGNLRWVISWLMWLMLVYAQNVSRRLALTLASAPIEPKALHETIRSAVGLYWADEWAWMEISVDISATLVAQALPESR